MSTQKPPARSERALFLSPEPPFPMKGGGALRSASILHFLAERFQVHLVTFRERGDGPNAEAAEGSLPLALTMVELPRHARHLPARIARNTLRLLRGRLPLSDRFCGEASLRQVEDALGGEKYSLGIIEHFWCAPYLNLIRPRTQKLILDLHNVESVLHTRCASTEPWPQSAAHAYFARVAAREERRILPKFDLVLTTSEADRRQVLDLCPDARVEVVPNTLPEVPEPTADEEHVVAFSGNFEYHPNITAVRHFREKVWPLLRKADPLLRWRLIGKRDEFVRSWTQGDDRIETTGPVEDAVSELARAKIAVVPLLSGSGTRLKILEAWAAARPVVATRLGAEGLPAHNGENLILVDEPRAMADTILDLLADGSARKRLGRAGRLQFERSGCWPQAWRALDRACLNGFTGSPAVKVPRCDNGI